MTMMSKCCEEYWCYSQDAEKGDKLDCYLFRHGRLLPAVHLFLLGFGVLTLYLVEHGTLTWNVWVPFSFVIAPFGVWFFITVYEFYYRSSRHDLPCTKMPGTLALLAGCALSVTGLALIANVRDNEPEKLEYDHTGLYIGASGLFLIAVAILANDRLYARWTSEADSSLMNRVVRENARVAGEG